MILNKKSLFGVGGLCLGNAAVIAISASSVVVAEGIDDVRSELNQIYWDQVCSQRECEIKLAQNSKHKWILGTNDNDRYKASRTKVIGKAIGDCVAGKNEFKDMTADDIIIFSTKATPNLDDYEQKHWNAVILCNYIHEAINGKLSQNMTNDMASYYDTPSDVSKVLGDKLRRIKTYYAGYYNRKKDKEKAQELANKSKAGIDKAVKDIQKYVEALKLDKFLPKFRAKKQAYNTAQIVANLAPGIAQNSRAPKDGNVYIDHLEDFFELSSEQKDPLLMSYKVSLIYSKGNLYLDSLYKWDAKPFMSDSGDLSWKEKSSADRCSVRTALEKHGKWILERLDGLVTLPDDQLWNELHPMQNK